VVKPRGNRNRFFLEAFMNCDLILTMCKGARKMRARNARAIAVTKPSPLRWTLLIAASALALLAIPHLARAQGVIRGAEEGANQGVHTGDRVAGPVGGAVGGAIGLGVGGVVGGVNGVLGIHPHHYHHRHHHY
jgi:hypothetical protein